ncbi:hypothetical protein LNA01_16130 [Companilactobacillus nantensis]|nr:hypothetical protein LNA01_16130 [Companilactobacillus nantensis]
MNYSYEQYLITIKKHLYMRCHYCKGLIKKSDNYCQWCGKPNLEK